MRNALLMLTIAGTLASCGGRSASSADVPRPTATRSINLVTAEEIQRHGGPNLLEVLRNLRPTWFRQKPTTMGGREITMDPVVAYLDGRRMGTIGNLQDIPVGAVIQVRYYTASEAQGRFGLDNLQGAIDVTTTR